VTFDGLEFIMPTAHLSERGIVRVTGEDAVAEFAQRLPERVRGGAFSTALRH